MNDAGPTQLARLRGLTAVFYVLLALSLAATLSAAMYLAYQANQQAGQNGRALVKIEEVNKRLIDCNNPGGRCYARKQTETLAFLVQIATSNKRLLSAAFVCNDLPGGQRIKTLTACINRELRRERQ